MDVETLVQHSVVTADPLQRGHLEELVSSAVTGAVVSFAGIVRDHDPEATGQVHLLEYSSHPDATVFLQQIVAEANRSFAHPDDTEPHPIRVVAQHRVGPLHVGEEALLVAVAAAHRSEAFTTCSDVVERIKAHVPIWKKQHTDDGDSHWVGAL